MMCECCDSPLHVYDPSTRWIQCSCGVFVNMEFEEGENSQPPVESVSLVANDIEKYAAIIRKLKEIGMEDGRIYDVCCGAGHCIFAARLMGIPCRGNDIKPVAVDTAIRWFGTEFVDLGEFEDIAESPMLEKGSYSAVIFNHGIEHVRSPRKAILAAMGLLKLGGLIFMAHPLMADGNWVRERGSPGHRHEWTFDAFHGFVRQFPLFVEQAIQSALRPGHDASQIWIVRKTQ